MRLRSLVVVVVLTISAGLCCFAKKFPLTAATIVPGAQGTVEIGKDKNGNTELKITVEHLAKPESLTPAKVAYVVWLQEKGADTENEGQLKVNKKLQATFKTVTPRKAFDVFITGEEDPHVKSPSGLEVLRATVQP
jgi:hypothetical protein